MTFIQTATKSVANSSFYNSLTGAFLKLFTFAALVSLILLIAKLLGIAPLSYLQVFLPVLGSLAIGVFFFFIAVIVTVANGVR